MFTEKLERAQNSS